MINLTVKEVFLTLLIIHHILSPYQARIKPVPSPCQVQVKVLLYGPGTELVRSRPGPDTVQVCFKYYFRVYSANVPIDIKITEFI